VPRLCGHYPGICLTTEESKVKVSIRFHLGPRIKISVAILSFPIRFHDMCRGNFDFNASAMLRISLLLTY
jgi:hypothetical protein